jgi:hypothetical protein
LRKDLAFAVKYSLDVFPDDSDLKKTGYGYENKENNKEQRGEKALLSAIPVSGLRHRPLP